MADPEEIKGSRREWEDARFKHGEMLRISAALSDKTAIGAFFTPVGGSADSGSTGRACVSSVVDTESLPGVFLFISRYKAYRTY